MRGHSATDLGALRWVGSAVGCGLEPLHALGASTTHLASATSCAQKDLGVTKTSKHRPAPENRWDPHVDGRPGAHAQWWTGAAWAWDQDMP